MKTVYFYFTIPSTRSYIKKELGSSFQVVKLMHIHIRKKNYGSIFLIFLTRFTINRVNCIFFSFEHKRSP